MGDDPRRKLEPLMLIFGPHRLLRHREVAIRESTRGYADEIGKAFGFPPKRRTAFGAKMEGDVEPARRRTPERPRFPARRRDTGSWKEGGYTEQRPGSPLAIQAMAKRNLGRLARAAEQKLAAVTRGVSFHGG